MPDNDLALLSQAAAQASEIAARYWRRSPEQWTKGDKSIVTEADITIDRFLREKLLAERPNYGWLSEETADGPARLTKERVFLVDPIDGTRCFAAGEPDFAIVIAILEAGEAASAIIHMPMLDKSYTATKGGGARLNGRRLYVSSQNDLNGAILLAPSSVLKAKHWKRGTPIFERRFEHALSYRFGLLAEGEADLLLSFRRIWDWDLAPGCLIAREAGAIVTDQSGSAPIFNSTHPKNAGLVAASMGLHGKVIQARNL